MRLRVLHIGAGNLYGGVETLLSTIARQRHLQPDLDHAFALFFNGRLLDELVRTGVDVSLLSAVRLSRPWTVWSARHQLCTLMKDRSFDAVICHSPWTYGVAAPVARRAKAPLILWTHGPMTGSWLDRWANRIRPDLYIANSRYTGNSMRHIAGEAPVQVLHCLVEERPALLADTRHIVRSRLNAAAEATVILQVGRMEPWKGHRLLLRALAQLKCDKSWECWIAGGAQRPSEHQYVRSLQSLASEFEIEHRVRFLGERTDIRELMVAADIFCQPNEQPEPFGIVFVEALLANLPVVTTSMGGALEIVDESCGALCKPDSSHLASVLRTFIIDVDLRHRAGSRGPERGRHLCDPGARLSDLHGILDGVIRRDRGTFVSARHSVAAS